jgi:hypothetical protein
MRGKTRMLAELVNDAGRIDAEAWHRAHGDRTPVARCSCGGPVLTDPTSPEFTVFHGVRWYSMRCVSCRKETELPGTRRLETEVRRPTLSAHAAVIELHGALTGDRT